MRYGYVHGVEKRISRIVFGCTTREMQAGRDVSPLLDTALDVGINTFDTARVYGKSENALGCWLKRQKREDIVVISKGCHPNDEGEQRVGRTFIKSDLTTSLDALRTDYIDIYLLHRDDPTVDVAEIMETLNECKTQGKIRAFGVSNWRTERIVAANAYAEKHGLTPFSCSSPHYSLAVQYKSPYVGECVTLTGDWNAASRTWYRETQFSTFAYSALANGLLTGKVRSDSPETFDILSDSIKECYLTEDNLRRLAAAEKIAEKRGCTVAQIALAWLLIQGLNVFALTSTASPERLRENASAAEITLTSDEIAQLDLA